MSRSPSTAGLLLAALLGLTGAWAAPVRAQTAEDPEEERPPTVPAEPLGPEETVRLDGLLEEPLWERALPATDFVQQEPTEGGRPSEPTEVRIAFDADHLYIGAFLHDSEPDGILAYQRQRDAGLGTDDRFMWILDTFLNGRSAYFFEINPAGLRGDGLLRADVSFSLNKSWDGIWDAEVRTHERGWTAEIRIPFRTLNFDPALDAWGINFQRTIRRDNEEMLWSGYRRNEGLFRPIHAGRVTGLEGLSQGIGLEATPYATAGWRSSPGLPVDDLERWPTDAGFDLTYSVTPELRASLTVNTDFAEVEVDRRRVNLTRFPLFFPEQRSFFLEGSDVFNFLPRNGVTPYFSRRIGLVEGSAVPIVAGARLTGQAAGLDVGFVQVRTGSRGPVPAEDFTALRLKRNILRQSSVGFVYTRRGRDDGEAGPGFDEPRGQLAGVDLDLFTSTFRGDRNLNFQAFYVFHTEPFDGGSTSHADRRTRGVRLAYPNDVWDMHVSFREFGDHWNPQVGFSSREGFRRLQPTVSRTWRPGGDRVREVRWEVAWEYLSDLDGLLLTRNVGVTLADVRLHSGDGLRLSVREDYERTLDPFDIAEDVEIPAGAYTFRSGELGLETARRRALSAEATLSAGEFWSGDRRTVAGEVTVRPRAGTSLAAGLEWNDVSLPQGDFTAAVARLEGGWHPTPGLSWTGTLQYDDVTEITGLFARLRWIVRPGSDLYLVYTHNWSGLDGPFRTLERAATTKLTYTYRF